MLLQKTKSPNILTNIFKCFSDWRYQSFDIGYQRFSELAARRMFSASVLAIQISGRTLIDCPNSKFLQKIHGMNFGIF